MTIIKEKYTKEGKMLESDLKNKELEGEEIEQFWKENKVGNNGFKLYKILTIIITVLVLVSLVIVLFAPYQLKSLYNGWILSYEVSTFELLTDGRLRVMIGGKEFDKVNFLILLIEFSVVALIFILNFIMLVKTIFGKEDNFKNKMFVKMFTEIKTPVVQKKMTRIIFAIIVVFALLYTNGLTTIANFINNEHMIKKTVTDAFVYMVIDTLLIIVVCVLLAIRRAQYNKIKNEIIKTAFYGGKDE